MPVKKKKRSIVRRRKKAKGKKKVHGAMKRRRTKRKPVKRKPAKRKATTHKKKKSKPKRRRTKRAKGTLVIQHTSVRTRRTVGKRKRTRKKTTKRSRPRRRVSGKGSGTGLLIGLAIGLGGLYLLSQTQKTTTPYPSTQYPPLQHSSNTIRNSQTSEIVSYAIAAGYAVDAITKLIEYLNKSSDNEVEQKYNYVGQTGELGYLA